MWYRGVLFKAKRVIGLDVTGLDIGAFLESLSCNSGGMHVYYRALRAFYIWLYSRKSGIGLNPSDNPILAAEASKVPKRILPSLTREQVEYQIEQAECIRDEAIISLFADSGLMISELANIETNNINWRNHTIRIIGKSNKEGLASFGPRTEKLLQELLRQQGASDKLFNLSVGASPPCYLG
jgi:site-specific recombinase XerC